MTLPLAPDTVPCLHEWRLIEEKPWYRGESGEEFKARQDAAEALVTYGRGVGICTSFVWVGYRRRWYCVRCRLVEETRHPDPVD